MKSLKTTHKRTCRTTSAGAVGIEEVVKGGLCIGVKPTCMLNKWRGVDIMGGGGRDQPICHMPARTSTNHFSASGLCLSRRACLIQCRPQEKGGSCPLGVPHFNSLHADKPQPPFPTEITVQRKSVPKPREGGLQFIAGQGHIPPRSLLATQQL